MRINHNISALNTHRLLNLNNTASSKTLEKLSSGKRINRAGDDAAGMAISEKMRAQVRGLQVASRNSLDGVSLVQTAEGAMGEVHSMLQRMRELSVQAANGTSAQSDRQAIQDEINQLTSEVNRIANGTEYNTRNVLKGNQGPEANATVHRMSTGEPAQTTGNVDVTNLTNTGDFSLASEQLSIWIDGEEKVVNLTQTNDGTKLNNFMDLVNDALGDSAKAVIDKGGQIEITTSSIGGLSKIEIKGSTEALKMFYSTVSADIPKAVAAESTVTISGKKFTINAGAGNGSLGNINIEFTEGSGTANAVWSVGTPKKLTVKLDSSVNTYSANDIKSLINGTFADANRPAGLDMTLFTVTGEDTIDITSPSVDLSTNPVPITLEKGVTAQGNFNLVGRELKISPGAANLGADSIKVEFREGTEGAKWSGNTLVVTLTTDKTEYSTSDIESLIRSATTNTPSGITDMSKFKLIETGTPIGSINLTGVDIKTTPVQTTLSSGVTQAGNIILGSVPLTINAGPNNSSFWNSIRIIFTESAPPAKADWVGNTLTVTLDNTNTAYNKDSILSVIKLASNTPSGINMNHFTVAGAGSINADTSTIGGSVTLPWSVSAKSLVKVAGANLTISAGTYNGSLGNVTINFTEGDTAGATWLGNTLTVTLDENKKDYKISDIELLIKGTNGDPNKPTGLDMSKFMVTGTEPLDLTRINMISNLSAVGKSENATSASVGTFYFDNIPDVGSTIQLGNEVIEFFDSSIAPYVGSNRPIDIAGKATAEAIVDEIVNKFATGIDGVKISKDPKFDSGNTPGTSTNARLIVEANKSGFDGNLIYLEGTPKEFTTNLQVGANTGQGFRLEIGDIRAKNLKISADNPTRNPGVKGASYVKTGATVTDGISSSMVEYAVDVTTEEKASAAIKVFDNAIVQIARERSRLGATQNRLEHTIANLDNTAENLTAAMSRIEDTDMALEMSNFQKLNVLQQAGVSMLAQANQQPQSVLKLLG